MSKLRKYNKAQELAKQQVSESQPTTEPDFDHGIIGQQTETDAIPANNFAEAAEKLEAKGIEPIAPVEATVSATRGVLPDAFGNNIKGERICSVCGIKESETLAKNPRYSFCKGKCVNCYGKTERKSTKPEEMTVEQIQAKLAYYTDLLAKKTGAQGLSEGNADKNVTIVTDNVTIIESGASADAKDDVETLAEISE